MTRPRLNGELVAMTAVCATHEGIAAVITCKRCGGFMCEACTEHRTEDRCVTCRPRRTVEERIERRRNATRRSPWMHCEACGYVGPRFERLGPLTSSDVVTVVALLVFVCVIGLALALQLLLKGTRRLSCPRCGAEDALWPATEQAGIPLDPAFLAANSANEQALRGRRRVGLLVVGVATLLGVLFVAAVVGLAQTRG